MKEYEFIDSLKSSFSSGVEGIGDDAVLYDNNILISKDILVEDIHFLKTTPLSCVISKLFTSNISDIAAMGGVSHKVLTGIAHSDSSKLPEILQLLKKQCIRYNVELIGGDTSSSKDKSFFSLTVIGKKNRHIISRSGARAGDIVYISRPLGLCRVSLEKELGVNDFLIDKYYHYNVRAEDKLGSFLGISGRVSSMTDISDGLVSELFSLSNSSKVKIVVDYNLLDFSHLECYDIDYYEYFMSSGEEYALVFTVSEEESSMLEKEIYNNLGINIIKIGRVEGGSGVYLKRGYEVKEINDFGYEHFK